MFVQQNVAVAEIIFDLLEGRQPSSPQKASLPFNDDGLCRSHPAAVPKKGRSCVS